jgi:hypothetical protein
MLRAMAAALLDAIRRKLPVPHMAYWLEPVLEVGRLIEAADPAEPVAFEGATP